MISGAHRPRASDTRYEELTVRNVLYNVDSRFRRYTDIPSTNYQFQFQTPVNHVVSIKISSVELPNSYPFISESLNTNTFQICYAGEPIEVEIPQGNYTATQLLSAIET